MPIKSSIFYRIKLKILSFYNLIWTSVYALKCRFSGHILDSQALPGFRKLIFCARRGCKFGHIEETYQRKPNES